MLYSELPLELLLGKEPVRECQCSTAPLSRHNAEEERGSTSFEPTAGSRKQVIAFALQPNTLHQLARTATDHLHLVVHSRDYIDHSLPRRLCWATPASTIVSAVFVCGSRGVDPPGLFQRTNARLTGQEVVVKGEGTSTQRD